MASSMGPAFSVETIYQDAVRQIENLRSTNQITQAELEVIEQTATPQQFLEAVNEQISTDESLVAYRPKLIVSIRPLLLQLERFGSAIDLVAQSSPQIVGLNLVGLIWGSLKMLILVARDIFDTFETVLATLEDVCTALSAWGVYIDIFGESKLQLLREPLTTIYAKLILFGLQVLKLFNRSVIRTLGRSVLKPLQLDVKSLIASTSKAKKDIETLAGAEHIYQTKEANRGLSSRIIKQRIRRAEKGIVQLLENHKAEEFRHLIGAILLGTSTRAIAPGSLSMAFNAAPIDLLSVNFGGRDTELLCLDTIFGTRLGHDVHRCTIRGMPGVGKTQLALKYAKLNWQVRYTFIIWLAASAVEKLYQGLADLLNLVGHVDRNHPEQSARLTAARRWLEDCQSATPKPWLLIVDNVNKDTLSFLREHLPRTSHGGDILFTTRTESVGDALVQTRVGGNNIVILEAPAANDAARILLEGTGVDPMQASSTDFARAIELVKSVGCLPLAVDQAASFMRQKKSSVEGLLSIYQSDDKSQFIGWQNELSNYEQRSIAATFDLQLDELNRSHPMARKVLSILSFLDTENIPVDMIKEAALVSQEQYPRLSTTQKDKRRFSLESLKGKIKRRSSTDTSDVASPDSLILELMGSPTQLQDALHELQDLSLIDQQKITGRVSIHIHDLVQYMIQAHPSTKKSCDQAFGLAMALMCQSFAKIPDPCSHECWTKCEVLIPHIQSLSKHSDTAGHQVPQLMTANIAIASYFRARGRYAEAEALFQSVLIRTEKQLGPTDPNTIQAKLNVASVYKRLGRYREVEVLLRQVVGELKIALKSTDLQTMRTLQALATVSMELGKYEEAVTLSTQTLARVKKILGLEHAETVRATQNLALIYEKQGDLESAEKLYEQALQGLQKLPGNTDPELQRILHNFAVVYSRQNRYDEAESLYEQAHEWRKKNLGPTHPETLSTIQNLAIVCYERNETDRAKELGLEAYLGRKGQLGSDHLETLQSAQNLAMVHQQKNEYIEAEDLYKTALTGFETQLGLQHPSTLRIVHNLAYCYECQERFDEAQTVYERAWKGRKYQLGPQHRDTLRTKGRLERLRTRE